jgi:hypothetical protein
MTMLQIPSEFIEILRLSDEYSRRHKERYPSSLSQKEVCKRVLEDGNVRFLSRNPEPLAAAIDALNDEDLQKLSGWILFGRDYSPNGGDPYEVLHNYVQTPIMNDHEVESTYLFKKPIGKYLRQALEHLSGSTAAAQEEEEAEEEFL